MVADAKTSARRLGYFISVHEHARPAESLHAPSCFNTRLHLIPDQPMAWQFAIGM